jgi:YHS domain-containing protein
MKSFLKLSALLAALVTGCATHYSEPAQDAGPIGTCYVCQYNNDLACVCVKLKDTTPRTEFAGQTFYFCSQDCRTAFLKNPARYLSEDSAK